MLYVCAQPASARSVSVNHARPDACCGAKRGGCGGGGVHERSLRPDTCVGRGRESGARPADKRCASGTASLAPAFETLTALSAPCHAARRARRGARKSECPAHPAPPPRPPRSADARASADAQRTQLHPRADARASALRRSFHAFPSPTRKTPFLDRSASCWCQHPPFELAYPFCPLPAAPLAPFSATLPPPSPSQTTRHRPSTHPRFCPPTTSRPVLLVSFIFPSCASLLPPSPSLTPVIYFRSLPTAPSPLPPLPSPLSSSKRLSPAPPPHARPCALSPRPAQSVSPVPNPPCTRRVYRVRDSRPQHSLLSPLKLEK